jgi:serine/threonine-protein kinase
LREAGGLVQLLPWDRKSGKLLVRREEDGLWRSNDPTWEAWPIFGISYLAAEEYAAWRTRASGDGWTYRLPRDIEWEKAARGADGRVYVWGDYMIWSYCWSLDGNRTKLPAAVGRRPLDESVYGVRDLEGSVEELVAGTLGDTQDLIVRRGGNWDSLYEQSYRLATRNGQGASARSRQSGIRLVADLPAESR